MGCLYAPQVCQHFPFLVAGQKVSCFFNLLSFTGVSLPILWNIVSTCEEYTLLHYGPTLVLLKSDVNLILIRFHHLTLIKLRDNSPHYVHMHQISIWFLHFYWHICTDLVLFKLALFGIMHLCCFSTIVVLGLFSHAWKERMHGWIY